METTIKDKLRHHLNPLHVFCVFKKIFNKQNALKVAGLYEKLVFKPLVILFF
ncbi:MAG: hypothetical protein OEV92_01425 [Nitrospinota bacterium]|nr:hypothetical protein [Nitrospinota bacterium]